MKKVLVIVVTYNGRQWLESCLSSVISSGAEGAVEKSLFVVDNDSTDGSADYVASHFPQARLVRSAENLGFSKANNLGFEWALKKDYDYVYLLNQDAWLAPGALEALVAAAEAHPDYAVLSPLQYQDGYQAFDSQFAKLYHGSEEGMGFQTASASLRPLPTRNAPSDDVAAVGPSRPGRDFPPIIPEGISALAGHGRGWPWVWKPTPSSEPDGVVEVKRIMAAHWLVPVGALKTVGPFEEELFPLYGQDDDWCNRVRYHGLKVGVVPGAKAVHDRAQRQETKEKVIRRNYYTGSLIRLCDPNRPLWERFLFVCLFTLVKSVKYGSLLPFKYFRQICGQLPVVRRHRDFSIRC